MLVYGGMMTTRTITDEMIREDVTHDTTRGSRDGEKSSMTGLRVEMLHVPVCNAK
jgi:hypothetical protein